MVPGNLPQRCVRTKMKRSWREAAEEATRSKNATDMQCRREEALPGGWITRSHAIFRWCGDSVPSLTYSLDDTKSSERQLAPPPVGSSVYN